MHLSALHLHVFHVTITRQYMASLSLHSIKQGQALTVLLRKRAKCVVLFFDTDSANVYREVAKYAEQWPHQTVFVHCAHVLADAQMLPEAKSGHVYWSGPDSTRSALCQRLSVQQLPWLVVLSDGTVESSVPPTAQRLADLVQTDSTTLEEKCQQQEETIRRLEHKVKLLTKELDSYAQLLRKYAPVIPELRRTPGLEDTSLSSTDLDYWDSCIGSTADDSPLQLDDICSRSLWVTTTLPRPAAISQSFQPRCTQFRHRYEPHSPERSEPAYSPLPAKPKNALMMEPLARIRETRGRGKLPFIPKSRSPTMRKPGAAHQRSKSSFGSSQKSGSLKPLN